MRLFVSYKISIGRFFLLFLCLLLILQGCYFKLHLFATFWFDKEYLITYASWKFAKGAVFYFSNNVTAD